MIRHGCVLTVLIVLISFLIGCAGKPSRLEMDHGTSFFLAKFNQTLNPEAEKNLEPVFGLDAQAALETIRKYRRGFNEKTKESACTININTGK